MRRKNINGKISLIDTDNQLRGQIMELIKGTEVSVSDFVRTAVVDHIFEIRRANERVEQERANRVKMAAPKLPRLRARFAGAV